MKTIILVTLFTGYFLPNSYGQSDPCEGKKYAEEYINPQTCQEKTVCVDDPIKDAPAGYTQCRWAPGTVLKYSTSNISQTCVDANALNQCIDDAFCAWTSLAACADVIAPFQVSATRVPANANDHTIVPINGTTVNQEWPPGSGFHEFGDDPTTVGQVIAVTVTTPQCEGPFVVWQNPSDRSFIDINMTSTYNNASIDVYPCSKPTGVCSGGAFKTPTDLCVAISHEIGHLMGLNHTPASPDDLANGIPDCSYHDPNGKDLMNPYITQGCDGNPPQWTINDCCQMHKMYCNDKDPFNCPPAFSCDNSSVNEGSLVPTYDPGLVAYPNPTTGMLTVQYSSNMTEMVNVIVFDILGNRLLSNACREIQGRDSHTLDLSFLPSGHYIVRIQGANLRASRMVKLSSK